MAKKAARPKKKAPKKPKKPPLMSKDVIRAATIAGECLASFGAGYAAQAATEGAPISAPVTLPPPPSVPAGISVLDLFDNPSVLQPFIVELITSSVKHKKKILWENPGASDRRTVLKMAFLHGMYARAFVRDAGLSKIDAIALKKSFDTVHAFCPASGGGGGPVCNFDM